MAINVQSDLIWHLELKVKNLSQRLASFETGDIYLKIKDECRSALRQEQLRTKKAEQELARAHAENVSMRKAWSDVFDDMEKEHSRELAEKDQMIKRLEKRALRAERQRNEALDKLASERKRFARQSIRLEEALGAAMKLKAQINRDYENSSKPSSAKENHKKICNNREKTGRKPGGQSGHNGHRRPSPEETDIVNIPAPEDILSDSDWNLTGKQIHKKVIDIGVIVTVTDYCADEFKHSKTGKFYHAPFPDGVINEVNYGAGIESLAYMLNSYCNVSIEKTRELISGLTGGRATLSVGKINNLGRKFSERTSDVRAKMFSEMQLSPVMYTDFTTGRLNGKGKAVMVCSDGNNVLYFFKEHKGHKGIKGTPVEDYQFTLVHDHDKTFLGYGGEHQECLAHVLRYLKDSMENEPDHTWNSEMYDFIKRMIHEAKEMGRKIPEEKCIEYEREFDKILEKARMQYEEEPPSDYYRDGFNLQKRLREYRDMQLLFLRRPDIDYTNNLSERLLRQFKRKQRQMTTFRSADSAENMCHALSIISTKKLNGYNAYDAITEVFKK